MAEEWGGTRRARSKGAGCLGRDGEARPPFGPGSRLRQGLRAADARSPSPPPRVPHPARGGEEAPLPGRPGGGRATLGGERRAGAETAAPPAGPVGIRRKGLSGQRGRVGYPGAPRGRSGGPRLCSVSGGGCLSRPGAFSRASPVAATAGGGSAWPRTPPGALAAQAGMSGEPASESQALRGRGEFPGVILNGTSRTVWVELRKQNLFTEI